MKLFEITNGFIGEAYVRAYAWAETTEQALELARPKFEEQDNRKAHWTELEARGLFDSAAPPFCTAPNDYGWETEK